KADAALELLVLLFQNGRFSVGRSSSLDRSSEASDGVPVGLMPERAKLDDGRYFGSVSLANRLTASLMPDSRPTRASTPTHSLSPAGSTGATVVVVMLADRRGGSVLMARDALSRASFQPVKSFW